MEITESEGLFEKEGAFCAVVRPEDHFGTEGGAAQILYKSAYCKAEYLENRVFIVINRPAALVKSGISGKTGVLFDGSHILFITPTPNELAELLSALIRPETAVGDLLAVLGDRMTSGDFALLESIEKGIGTVEEKLLTGKRAVSPAEIVAHRKNLLKLKQYYEQMIDVADSVLKNDRGFLDGAVLPRLSSLMRRLNRLSSQIINLRDYVTQVREAYQSQVDIDQNKLMKIFTMITVIFLPLQLIVGWYGMNLVMPEVQRRVTYPVVAALCAVVVVTIVLIFKKRKWF